MRRVEAPTRANTPLVTYDEKFDLVKINPIAAWSDDDMEAYIEQHNVLVNPLVGEGYPSIGCAPCTAKPAPGADPAVGPLGGYGQDRMRVARPMTAPTMDALDALESEAIHIFREVAGEFDRPVILFSGGKDSTLLVHLAVKAFAPAPVPFPLLHVDTGHNYPEVIDFRDRLVERLDLRLHVAHVQEWIDDGRLTERPDGTRNPLQTVPLLDSIVEHKFDAVFGGGRRDEERARAKERIISLRDAFGRWDPRSQRPELWNLYNGRHAPGEHVRVFPISNWTELDVWRYIQRERIEPAVDLLQPPARGVPPRRDVAGGRPVGRPARRRVPRTPTGALPHRRRRLLHRRRRVHRLDARRDHRRGHGVTAHRTGRHAR